MSSVRRLTVELRCDAAAVAGEATDEQGLTRHFDGWLDLITIVQAIQREDAAPDP